MPYIIENNLLSLTLIQSKKKKKKRKFLSKIGLFLSKILHIVIQVYKKEKKTTKKI